jgi:hypothetical protein
MIEYVQVHATKAVPRQQKGWGAASWARALPRAFRSLALSVLCSSGRGKLDAAQDLPLLTTSERLPEYVGYRQFSSDRLKVHRTNREPAARRACLALPTAALARRPRTY